MSSRAVLLGTLGGGRNFYMLPPSPGGAKGTAAGGERVITEIEIEGFKSLEKVHLKLGGFNLFIGANASGKSNFLDALRILQGIGHGFTIDEIFKGKPKGAASEIWEGIRGGSSRARFVGLAERAPGADLVTFKIGFDPNLKTETFFYSIGINPDRAGSDRGSRHYGTVEAEELRLGSRVLFHRDRNSIKTTDAFALWELGVKREKPALRVLGPRQLDLGGENSSARQAFVDKLSDMQRVSPKPEILRSYGQVFLAERMGESGENFPSLVKEILQEPSRKSAYQSWLQQLNPAEAEDIEILEGALGEPLFSLRAGSRGFPAPVLSDGTLRFAALAAAFFQPDMPDILTIEEIENGIHPSRLRLLVELLKSQSAAGTPGGPQVFATTHSPIVLAWLEESDYETTFLCRRDEETGASIIKPISEIPFLVEVVRKQPISELFAEGWLEGAF